MASYPRVSVEPRVPLNCTLGRTLYEAAHEKRYLMALSGKYEILNFRVALDFESTPLKTVLKNLDLPHSYDCFRNTKSA